MSYLVMETHPAYAVLLDEEGRFLKAANLRYQVGDTVQDIVELQPPKAKPPALWKPLSGLAGLAGLAACVCLVFFGYYQPNYTAYGTLRIQINPDVEITVSRTDRVLGLDGLNEDGEALIAGYAYQGKDRETAAGELVERAIDMGYLSDGETVSITVTSADADWQAREEQEAREDLEERYGQTIVIQIGPLEEEPPATEIVIPVTPPTPEPTPEPSPEPTAPPAIPDSTDYGTSGDGVTDYQDTDYGPYADGVTDYTDTGGETYSDGVTDYTDTGGETYSDGVTDYTDTGGETYSDGVTDYEARDDDDWDDSRDDGDDDDDDDSEDDDDGGDDD